MGAMADQSNPVVDASGPDAGELVLEEGREDGGLAHRAP